MTDVNKIGALLELGWTYRKIARELGVHRTTVARYGRERRSKPTNLIAGPADLENRPNPIAGSEIKIGSSGPTSIAHLYHDFIAAGLEKGLSAQRIWRDLVEERGYTGGYLTVQRYPRRIRRRRPEVAAVMEHPPGKESQVDFFLELLVEDELARRDLLFARRLKQARIPEVKTFDNFDWSFHPKLPKPLILDLTTTRFVRDHGGVLLIGPPGTGKSHIALALTCNAIAAGHTALYRSAFDLVQDFREAEATGTRKPLVHDLVRVDLLVIEDLGMRQLPHAAAEDLLEVFTRRYEQGAIILTTNRPIEDWGQVLGDTAAAGAILDRFLHHAEVINLRGMRSRRMHERQQRRRGGQEADASAVSQVAVS